MIIVFGTLTIDMYIPSGVLPDVNAHVRCAHYQSFPGGKGANQAFSASRSGAKTAIIGKIGDDAFGRRSTASLKRESILGSGIGKGDLSTGCDIILPGQGEDKTIVSCIGANAEATSSQIPNEILTPKNTVVAQLLIPIEETLDLFTRAKERGSKTVLNASPPQYTTKGLLDKTDMVFVNERELFKMCKAVDAGYDESMSAEDMTKAFAKDFGVDCVTTLGSKGLCASFEGDMYHMNAFQIEKVVDATGGGDCALGYLVGLMDQGFEFSKAMQYASIAGSLACRKQGAQSAVPFLEDVTPLAAEYPLPEGQI